MRKYLARAMAVAAVAGAMSVPAVAPAAANDAAAYLQDAAQCHIWLLSGDARYVENCTPSHVAVSFKSLSEPGTVGMPRSMTSEEPSCEGKDCECAPHEKPTYKKQWSEWKKDGDSETPTFTGRRHRNN